MVVQGIASSYNFPTTKSSSSGDGSMVSKDDFLKLLVTQLSKQDPMNPSDPSQFTAQLAQFSSLEQLVNVNSALSGLSGQNLLNSQLTAASLIGKSVQVKGTNINVASGTASSIHYNLPAASTVTSVNVYDQNNKLVDVVPLGQQGAGGHDFQWDGQLTNGTHATDGAYHFDITAQDATGKGITATSSLTGTVSGVSYADNGQILLKIGGATYTLGDILSIGTM